jgi:aquaporin Z
MRKYITEGSGTFLLVLVMGLSQSRSGDLAPLASGLMLAALTYAGAFLSGAHFNPALSLAVFIRRRMEAREMAYYVAVQLLGALLGAAVAGLLILEPGFEFTLRPGSEASGVQALLAEALFSFGLAWVYLHCLTEPGQAGNSYYGLAIGAAYFAAHYAAGPVSGGALNPALGLAPNLLSANWQPIWIYLLGPALGGSLAGFVYLFQHPQEEA